MLYGEEQKMEIGNGRNAGFLRPLISAYSLPLHGITAIPGKISGALMVVNSIEDAVPLIHGPVGCAFQRKINPFRPYLPFYETPCTDMNDVDVVYGGEDKLSLGIRETYEKYHPNLIVVLTTCPSDLIGDDFKAVIEERKAKLKEALKKPQRRNPLLSMLEYDPYRTNLIPEWATLADMFGTLREEAVGDKERYKKE